MFRVGKEHEQQALSRPGARSDGHHGQTDEGLRVGGCSRGTAGKALEAWIELAARYVGALPPK